MIHGDLGVTRHRGLGTTALSRLAGAPVVVWLVAGCASTRTVSETAIDVTPSVVAAVNEQPANGACLTCATLESALLARSTQRAAELKGRGGECAVYGAVLEHSVQGGKVSVRPFMWRVGTRLVSGEAKPDGNIVVARHIDALNVGVRTVEDMLWTLEHEAAHIAFSITNGDDARDDGANFRVRDCR